ncbi:MAG TPA: hypothetical protein VEY91_00890 [Candidatus Limnocylindria bacterium]|nr:hypothetical protein [Candidatus Limnocylindria bacterium]
MAPLKSFRARGPQGASGATHELPPAAAWNVPPAVGWAALLALLALLLAFLYGDALSIPFINDDYVFLDKTRRLSFLTVWAPRDLAFHWYRPWSRELHYWTLQSWFGNRETPFHLASFALWIAVLAVYFAIARRLAGARAAAVATAAVGALAAWGVPLLWIAGVQELWMLLFVLLALLALVHDRLRLATGAFVLALLSKESAAVLPALAFVHQRWVAGRTFRSALTRTAPMWILLGVWAAWHPMLGGRLWRPVPVLDPGLHPPFGVVLLRTLLMPFNLDAMPAPESRWVTLAAGALPVTAIAAILILLVPRLLTPGRALDRAPHLTMTFGLAWAAIAWAPLFTPAVGWHAYYAMLGALGVWLALAGPLSRRPPAAVAAVVLLVVLRAVHADTPSRDWGSEWYPRRAGSFLAHMRTDLKQLHPVLPPHSRLYFVMAPSNVGFLPDNGSALRIWYGDPTLRGGYYPSYRPRARNEPAGADYFFRFDSTGGWVPVIAGNEDASEARHLNPRWVRDHEVLAGAFAHGGDWRRAAGEYAKLAHADSLSVDPAFNAGVSFEAAGDSMRAAEWYRRAAARPGADAEVRETATRFARHLHRRF